MSPSLTPLPPQARTIGLIAHLPPPPAGAQPDTTAIVLNWSRLPNVQRIAATLCAPALAGIVAQVFIWNNSPTRISYDVRARGTLLH